MGLASPVARDVEIEEKNRSFAGGIEIFLQKLVAVYADRLQRKTRPLFNYPGGQLASHFAALQGKTTQVVRRLIGVELKEHFADKDIFAGGGHDFRMELQDQGQIGGDDGGGLLVSIGLRFDNDVRELPFFAYFVFPWFESSGG